MFTLGARVYSLDNVGAHISRWIISMVRKLLRRSMLVRLSLVPIVMLYFRPEELESYIVGKCTVYQNKSSKRGFRNVFSKHKRNLTKK